MGTEESKGGGGEREWGERRRRVRCGESVRAERKKQEERKERKRKLHKVRPRGTVP